MEYHQNLHFLDYHLHNNLYFLLKLHLFFCLPIAMASTGPISGSLAKSTGSISDPLELSFSE